MLNQMVLVGRLVSDPEVKTLEDGKEKSHNLAQNQFRILASSYSSSNACGSSCLVSVWTIYVRKFYSFLVYSRMYSCVLWMSR